MSQNRKILLLGVDGLIPELVERFCAEGVLPNMQRRYRETESSMVREDLSRYIL